MMESQKPPLGTKPAWLVAWSRIGELAEAITRHYESSRGNAELCEKYAKEIVAQCQIIQFFNKND